MDTPIQVLVREIRDESQNACELYSHMKNKASEKIKKLQNDAYVTSIRRISELVHAIERLTQI